MGNVSTSPLSSSISSKLLVSMSLLSSGTTGATADEGVRERKKGKGLNRRKKGKCCVNKRFSLINNLMLYSDAAAVPQEFAV